MNKKFYVAISIVTAVFVLVFSVIISMYQSIQNNACVNANGYSIVDKFDEDELKAFLSDDTSVDKLKKMYDLFKNEWASDFYIMTAQSVITENRALSDEFIYGYGNIDLDELELNFVNCMQMNDNAIKNSNMQLLSGRYFYDSEYIYEDTVPVILGYNYKEYLKENDELSINYLGKDLNIKVIGFLKEGSYMAKSDYNILDNYIVMPALEFTDTPIDEEDMLFQLKVYLGHTNAYVYSDNSLLKEECKLDNICKAVDIKPFVFTGIFTINLFGLGYANSIYCVVIFTTVAFCLEVVLLSYWYYRKIKKAILNSDISKSKNEFRKLIFSLYLKILICMLFSFAFLFIMCVGLNCSILMWTPINIVLLFLVLFVAWLVIPLFSMYKLFKINFAKK